MKSGRVAEDEAADIRGGRRVLYHCGFETYPDNTQVGLEALKGALRATHYNFFFGTYHRFHWVITIIASQVLKIVSIELE